MSDKYVKQFFELTEHNISEVQTSANESFSDVDSLDLSESHNTHVAESNNVIKQCLLRFIGLLLLPIVGLTYILHAHAPKVTPMPQTVKQNTSVPKAPPRLVSVIPGFRVAAIRQTLHEVSLRKADLVFLDSEDENGPMTSMPVMDKVLFIPKTFG